MIKKFNWQIFDLVTKNTPKIKTAGNHTDYLQSIIIICTTRTRQRARAASASDQANMTSEIQNRLENTSQIAENAKETSDALRQSIIDGRTQSNELEKQSQIVDEMNNEVVAVLDANNKIVSSIATLAAISEQMSSNAIQSAEDSNSLAESMDKFTNVINETSTKINELRRIVTG